MNTERLRRVSLTERSAPERFATEGCAADRFAPGGFAPNRFAAEGFAAERFAPSDDALLARIAAGDAAAGDALAVLFDRHAGAVLGLLERLLGRGGEADEILQEVFLQAWSQAGRYAHDRHGVRAWLLMIARSRAFDRLRSASARRRREERLMREALAWAPAPGCDRLLAVEERRALSRALAALPAAQRDAIELAFFQGLTHVEVAARLGAPLGTVKSRILLGLRRLREALESEGRAMRRQAAA